MYHILRNKEFSKNVLILLVTTHLQFTCKIEPECYETLLKN
jgi:hypothetical protein